MSREIITLEDLRNELDLFGEQITKLRAMIGESNTVDSITSLLDFAELFSDIQQNIRRCLLEKPVQKFFSGQEYTKLEFYLLAARGFLKIHSTGDTEDFFDEYSLYYYQDERNVGYINPSGYLNPPPIWNKEHTKRTRKVQLKIGVVPENVKISCLRKDQKEYFSKYEPELYFRFKQE